MDILIWLGAAVSLAGVGLLVHVIIQTFKARNNSVDEDALNRRLQSLAAVNMGALAISAIGRRMWVRCSWRC